MKVLNYTGLQNLWTNIRNYITAHTPTSTSELTNDSGFLTSTDISSKANDSEVVHKAQTETITGEKTFKKDVKIIDLNSNERPGVQFEIDGDFRTFEEAEDALPDNDGGGLSIGGFDIGGSVWSGFVKNDYVKLQNSMSDYVINDITFASTNDSSVIEFNNYYKVKYNDDSGMQTDLRGMLRFELSPYANVEKGDQLWSDPNLYFYAMLDGESGNTILGHKSARWSKAYIDEINCNEINIHGNSITSVLENILSLSYVTHYSSTALTSNSTNSLSIIDNQDSVRVNDKVIDSAGKMFYITSVDLNNDEFEVGSVVDTFAKDSSVIHTSGNETVGGVKTFSDDTFVKSLNFTNEVANSSSSSSAIFPIVTTVTYADQSPSQTARLNLRITADGIKSLYPHENNAYSLGLSSRSWSDFYTYHGYFCGQQQGDEYSSNTRTNLTLLSNRDKLDESGILFDTYRQNTAQGTGIHILGISIKENSVRYEGCRFGWYWDNILNGYYLDFKPTTQGIYQAVKHNLGTSIDKWDTINGLEPSALGMPDLDNGIDISSYLTNAGTVTPSEYTPSVNGYICIQISADSPPFIRMYNDYGFDNTVYTERNESGSTSGGTYTRFASLIFPANKDVKVYIIIMPNTFGIISAKFYPCLGNV